MKKITIKSCIAILTLCLLFSTGNTGAQTATTEAQIEFVAGVGPTYPVDPENPGTYIETETPVSGSLAFVSVSHFNFGAIPLTPKAGLYDIVTEQPNIQIVDLRGSGTGWDVTATVSNFKTGAEPSLPGASIHIYKGRPNSVSHSPAPAQTENLELPADGTPRAVISADDGAGVGLWVMRWYPEETGVYIQLEVPAGIGVAGVHKATIQWTLEDTPV